MVTAPRLIDGRYLIAFDQYPNKQQLENVGTWECFEFANTSFTPCLITYLPSTMMGVLAVDEDSEISTQACQYTPPWHLSRIVQKDKWQWTWPYRYPEVNRQIVTVYVLDTFIDCQHQEFQGRCSTGFSNQYTVNNPHGTHVAGLIASKTFGVNKFSRIFSVQVLNDDGRGSWSKLVEGLGYVSRHAFSRKQPSVINISIGGSPSTVVDMAIRKLFEQGILTIVAAGNSNDNACYYSPSRANDAVTVAASNYKDEMAGFSNWGSCVDIIAPGDGIQSTMPNDQSGHMSGTSMASPIVAGIASVILSLNPKLSPLQLKTELTRVALKNIVANPKGSPNLVAFQPYGKCQQHLDFLVQN